MGVLRLGRQFTGPKELLIKDHIWAIIVFVKNDKKIILAILFAIISLCAFTVVLDRFLTAREEAQNELGRITFSSDSVDSNPAYPIERTETIATATPVASATDDSKSSIDLGDGRRVIAKLDDVSATTTIEEINSPFYVSVSRALIVDGSGNVLKEIYKYEDSWSYLKVHKLSSDKDRLYFYAKADGLGGYYAFDQIFPKKFFEYNFKTGKVREIIVKNSTKLKMQRIEDVSDDGNIVAFTREKTSTLNKASSTVTVAVYYIKENITFDLPNLSEENYTLAGGAKFEGSDKIIYFTAVNNPDDEVVKTIEYDLRTKTYKVLRSV